MEILEWHALHACALYWASGMSHGVLYLLLLQLRYVGWGVEGNALFQDSHGFSIYFYYTWGMTIDAFGQALNDSKHGNNMKLTIITKIRETRAVEEFGGAARFFPPDRWERISNRIKLQSIHQPTERKNDFSWYLGLRRNNYPTSQSQLSINVGNNTLYRPNFVFLAHW